MMSFEILEDKALVVLQDLVATGRKVEMIYIDPPFNTGKKQKRKRTENRKENKALSALQYEDSRVDYQKWLYSHLCLARDVLTANGSVFVHLDWRESHRAKIMLDEIFGMDSFINEIIWAYDYGGRSKKKYSAKHDVIFWYAKDPKDYIFNYDVLERIPYMAPGLVGKEKAARGKTITDTWWHTIVPTNGKEKTGYPTQKPLGILRRLVSVHTNPGDTVLDFFAGSGTTGIAAFELGRNTILVDKNLQAIKVMQERIRNAKLSKHN